MIETINSNIVFIGSIILLIFIVVIFIDSKLSDIFKELKKNRPDSFIQNVYDIKYDNEKDILTIKFSDGKIQSYIKLNNTWVLIKKEEG